MSESDDWIPVAVRKVWPLEADFTTWLAGNLDMLSAEIGIDLELIQEETTLPGNIRVDILARVAGTGEYVVIENQMEDSDNDHFAGLLHYASHSDSRILILVAGEITHWYRRTMDWLNDLDGVAIYGVEMSAWSKGERVERRLKVVAGPNHRSEWHGYTYPAAKRTYLDFFQPVVAKLSEEGIANTSVAKASNNQTFPSGFPGIAYNIGFFHSFRGHPSLDVYLWIAKGDRERNKEIFDALFQYREEVESELQGVGWDRRDNQRMCSIYLIKPGSIWESEETLAALQTWALDKLPKLKRALQPRLEKVMSELEPAYPETTP